MNWPERNRKAPAPINLQSIAEYSRIPRETVRRKLRDLERLGWIIRGDNGYLITTVQATRDLTPATEETLRYLLTAVTACNQAYRLNARPGEPHRRLAPDRWADSTPTRLRGPS